MNIKTERMNDIIIITVDGKNIEAKNVAEFEEKIGPILGNAPKIIFNMRHVSFIDSSGCGFFLSCLRKKKLENGEMNMYALTESVKAIFRLIRMDRMIEIYDKREEAIQAFEDPRKNTHPDSTDQ